MKDFFLLDSSLSKKAYPFLALGARVFIGFLMLTHGKYFLLTCCLRRFRTL